MSFTYICDHRIGMLLIRFESLRNLGIGLLLLSPQPICLPDPQNNTRHGDYWYTQLLECSAYKFCYFRRQTATLQHLMCSAQLSNVPSSGGWRTPAPSCSTTAPWAGP